MSKFGRVSGRSRSPRSRHSISDLTPQVRLSSSPTAREGAGTHESTKQLSREMSERDPVACPGRRVHCPGSVLVVWIRPRIRQSGWSVVLFVPNRGGIGDGSCRTRDDHLWSQLHRRVHLGDHREQRDDGHRRERFQRLVHRWGCHAVLHSVGRHLDAGGLDPSRRPRHREIGRLRDGRQSGISRGEREYGSARRQWGSRRFRDQGKAREERSGRGRRGDLRHLESHGRQSLWRWSDRRRWWDGRKWRYRRIRGNRRSRGERRSRQLRRLGSSGWQRR